jgi:hypothetical protein
MEKEMYKEVVERVKAYLAPSQWNIDLREVYIVEVEGMETQWGDPLSYFKVYYGDVPIFNISFQHGDEGNSGGWNHEGLDRFLEDGHPALD